MGWIVIGGKRVTACYSKEIYKGYLDDTLDDQSPTVQSFRRCLSLGCPDCQAALQAVREG